QSSTVSSKETLTQILRTYALIDQTKSAEEVIREDLVAPFIQETVSRPVLDNPSQQSTSHVYPARSTHPQSQISTKAYFTNAYSKEPLALMYNRILKFINAECYILLKITRNDLKGTSFEILVNSVWVEVVDSITKKLPVIFNPGNPNTFHKNYTISMNFLLSIESMCVSKKSLLYLRNHSSYMEFMKRWQLPVYFQLR
ncbi:16825_t:CDS:2, partial [Acaulospora morrowiae]